MVLLGEFLENAGEWAGEGERQRKYRTMEGRKAKEGIERKKESRAKLLKF